VLIVDNDADAESSEVIHVSLKLCTWYEKCSKTDKNTRILECGPISYVLVAQPNIGGALCESSVIPFLVACRKFWLTLAARVPCSNAANIGERKTLTQSEFFTWQNSVRRARAPKMYI